MNLKKKNNKSKYDKIVNHLVSRYILYPTIFPCLVKENCSSVPNKGTDYALKLYYDYNRKIFKQSKNYYVLKYDIKSYFDSINHDILKSKIQRRIKDKDSLNIVFDLIDSFKEGLPIVFMSSQILGIFYLNDLDHFIKEELKIKMYVRYQDDFLLFHTDKNYLKYCLKEIIKFLNKEKLKLNNKSRIFKNTNNFVFLGRNKYKKYCNYRRVNKKLKKRKYYYDNDKITLQSYITSYICYKRLNQKV